MTNSRWFLASFALLASFVPPAPAAAPAPPQACVGCLGAGGTGVSSGGTCAGIVSISVQTGSGQCKWFLTDEPLLFECRETVGCDTTIVRSWSGLPTGSVVEHCVKVGGESLCLKKKTLVDEDGGGGSTRTGPMLPCQEESMMTFQVASEDCGLSAEVTPTCSSCVGDM